MPINLSIKRVPDALAERLRARAAANHRSLQRELLAIVEIAAARSDTFIDQDRVGVGATEGLQVGRRCRRPIEEIAAEVDRLLPNPRQRGPSSTEIVRAMRDARYGDARRPTTGSREGNRR